MGHNARRKVSGDATLAMRSILKPAVAEIKSIGTLNLPRLKSLSRRLGTLGDNRCARESYRERHNRYEPVKFWSPRPDNLELRSDGVFARPLSMLAACPRRGVTRLPVLTDRSSRVPVLPDFHQTCAFLVFT